MRISLAYTIEHYKLAMGMAQYLQKEWDGKNIAANDNLKLLILSLRRIFPSVNIKFHFYEYYSEASMRCASSLPDAPLPIFTPEHIVISYE